MHFHLPKPLHGWRAFAGEVGIIVVGVLIALGAEQVVSGAHDRSTAAEARANIMDEIRFNMGTIMLREKSEACEQKRLREIDSYLDAVDRGQRPKPLQWVGAPFAPLLFHTNFQAAQSAGKFFLLPTSEQRRLAQFYVDFDDFNEAATREWYDWAALRSLAGGHPAPGPAEIDRLRAAVQDARAADWFVRIDSSHPMESARQMGVAVSPRPGDPYQVASVCLAADTPYAEAVKLAGRKLAPFPE
ncbi:MAG TPA: hypothetical protein VFW39_01895 [Sphingomicrobium sp.]|nr:hypothetical protein [Sphingomicrobium sp.]